jgi:putative peptidoglycan lipid II flippase
VASSMFPLYLLSGFGSGVISVMNYGKNIADIPNTLITSQFANVSGIKLNEQFARHDAAGMNDTFLRLSKMMIFILVPVGCFMFVFAEPVILLFYKTEKFTAESVAESARFLQLLSVSIFSIAVNTMVARLFIAAQVIRQAFVYQFVMNCFLIVSIWLFSKYYGAYGYPYGIILVNAVNFMAMYFICKQYFKNIQYDRLLNYTALVMLINIPVAVILFYALKATGLYFLYQLLLGGFIYIVLFAVMSKIKQTRIYESF